MKIIALRAVRRYMWGKEPSESLAGYCTAINNKLIQTSRNTRRVRTNLGALVTARAMCGVSSGGGKRAEPNEKEAPRRGRPDGLESLVAPAHSVRIFLRLLLHLTLLRHPFFALHHRIASFVSFSNSLVSSGVFMICFSNMLRTYLFLVQYMYKKQLPLI